jgi:hypothetical protein
LEECTPEDSCEITFPDTSPVQGFKFLNLTAKLILHLREAHYIKPLEYMCAVGWIAEDYNVVSPSIVKKLK